jgi:6-phosphogluconolactonase
VSEPEIVVVADDDIAAGEAASRIAQTLVDGVACRGRVDWVTTGGSALVARYRRMAEPPLVDAIPWDSVHVWWTDDRYVPRDHPLSNVKPFDDVLLVIADREEGTSTDTNPGVPLRVENIHPFRTGEAIGRGAGAASCAAALADELRAAGLPEQDGWPVFDLMVLGVGPDGHILSVFPGSEAFDSTELALAIPAPTHIEPHVERVTLNPAIVGVARQLIVVVHGKEKAPVLADVFGAERDPRRWPAQLARREGALWILDEAAASGLPGR